MKLTTFLKMLPNGKTCTIYKNNKNVTLLLTRKLIGQNRQKLTEIINTEDELLLISFGISLQDRILSIHFDETSDEVKIKLQ